MKALQRANINTLISSLIWGLVMSFAIRTSRQFITNDRVFDIVWYGGRFLTLMLYPILVSFILGKKTGLWINVCFFSMIGGMLLVAGIYAVSSFQVKSWTNVGFGAFSIWLIGYFLTSKIDQSYAATQEWDSPFWEKLNQASFWEFLLLRFDTIDSDAG